MDLLEHRVSLVIVEIRVLMVLQLVLVTKVLKVRIVEYVHLHCQDLLEIKAAQDIQGFLV